MKFLIKIDLGNNYFINERKSYKYFLIFDNLLKFDFHIDHIIYKINKKTWPIYGCSSLLPSKYRKMFDYAHILPYLTI